MFTARTVRSLYHVRLAVRIVVHLSISIIVITNLTEANLAA
jgi:hypothetical protein